MPTAVLFLTHRRDARVLAHFERLKKDLTGVLPVFLGVDDFGQPPWPATLCPPDVRIDRAVSETYFPGRQRLPSDHDAYLWIPAVHSLMISQGFRHVWLIEYDVDFAGCWADFFSATLKIDADLLGTHFTTRNDSHGWYHWPSFACPASVPPEAQMRGFLPATRLSRRLVETYVAGMRDLGWQGHFEATIPSIATANGMTLMDLYSLKRPDSKAFVTRMTFRYRPRIGRRYWHEKLRSLFRRAVFTPGMLHHPVKIRKRR